MEQIEIDIEELAKAKKRVWVKATSTRKGHYREQKVGEKVESKRSFKITPDYIRDMELDEKRTEQEGSVKVSDKVISTLERERTHKLDSGTGDVDAGMAHGIQYVLNTIKDSKNNTLSTSDIKELKGKLIDRLDNPDSDYHVGEGHGIRLGLTELGVRT